MKKNSASNYESVNIVIDRNKYPILFENKVQCLMLSGLSRDEAENCADGCVIELELYYEIGTGLFGVESEAVECSPFSSPYTKEELEEDDSYKYYQPEIYTDDGINIGWELPSELASFHVFRTKEECEDWLEENGYDLKNCTIHEYHDDDIEDYVIVE